MLFTAGDFWIFFGAVFVAYFFVPHKFRWLLLLGASYFFYGYWNPAYLPLLILPTLVIYVGGRLMGGQTSANKRRLLLGFSLLATLGLLIVFKYLDLLAGGFHALAALLFRLPAYKPLGIILPIGISFYTFKLLSYILDVYYRRLEPEKHAGYFALYTAFFPHLLAGPIERAGRFLPELKKRVHFDPDRIAAGLQLVTWGLFKKMVIADRLALFVGQVFNEPQGQGINLVFGAYFYAFQIYCDFSGYSDIAVGLARILGFESMKNFDFPYFSQSITQFWTRWHISLSTWLRDYLFLPLAYATMRPIRGERLWGIKAETWGYIVGISLTMFLGGLWHGANWTLVIWGCVHGIFLALAYSLKRPKRRLLRLFRLQHWPRLHRSLSIVWTFNLVTFAWIFFRAPTIGAAWDSIGHLQLKWPAKGYAHLLFNLLLLALFIIAEYIYKNWPKFTFLRSLPRPVKIAAFALFVCLLIIFSVDTGNEFIYFQF